MTLLEALLLGIVQGATEFLPISSTGHLALAHLMVGAQENDLLFDVVAHLGTMLSIAILLRKRLVELTRAALSYLGGPNVDEDLRVHRRWVAWIVLASLPTAAVGLALERPTEAMRLEPAWLGLWFCTTAALLIAAERIGARNREAGALGPGDAVLMGIAQGLAVLPGLSRSGSTVAAGLWRGLDPRVAVDFSLLISLPAVLGANLLKLPEAELSAAGPLALGFVAALVTGIGAVKILQWIVVRRRLLPFAAYAGLLGIANLIWAALGGLPHG